MSFTVNNPGIIDFYNFDEIDEIQCVSPQQQQHSESPSLSPSQYLRYQREAVFVQANEGAIEETIF